MASLVFDQAERKPLTDDLRSRLAARAAVLKLETLTPYFGSLERDPVHPSAYYLAVDGIEGSPHLLYMALSTAPTSSIFHRPLLIGRMRRVNGPELVINASPFGPDDRQNIDLFASKINSAFLPRPLGSRVEIAIPGAAPGAFDLFRAMYKRAGKNVAAMYGDYHTALWAAIRAGWRLGYAAIGAIPPGSTGESIRPHAGFTRFSVDVSTLEPFEPAVKAAEQVHEQIRQVRAALKLTGSFEFEVVLPEVSSNDLEFCLDWLKTRGHPAQFVATTRLSGDLAAAAAIARQQQVVLSFLYRGENAEAIQEAARATLGRIAFRVQNADEAAVLAEHLLT